MDSEQLQKKLEKAQRNYQSRHLNNLNSYAVSLEKLYDALAHSAAVAGRSLDVPGDRLLKLEDYPAVNRRINKLVRRLTANISAIATKGVSQEWALANDCADELVKLVCAGRKVSEATKSRWLDRREKALDEFRKRKTNGLDLSERVWQLGEQAKKELELALDCGIRDGVAALRLAPTLKQYLKEPNRLYRRVRDTLGNLHPSKAEAQYHPGRGVYRSSFANAKRLVGTETNIAYRTADHERMQRLDFVVGIKIELSNNHTTKGPKGLPIPLTDICDELQGKYPKDFKFTGWHPNCRCHAKSILLTPAELDEMLKAQADGKDTRVDGVNKVSDVPRGFTRWMKNNKERVKYVSSAPYFVMDNAGYVPRDFIANIGVLKAGVSEVQAVNVREAILKIKDPTFVTERDVKVALTNFAVANPPLFNGSLAKVEITRKTGVTAFMANRRYYAKGAFVKARGNTLVITNKDLTTSGGTVFNPLHEVKGAMKAIAEKAPLTFNQEYALECLWHEFRHAAALGWKDVRHRTPSLTSSMEVINQFCARLSYPSFVRSLGGKAIHTKKIMEKGYGYGQRVSNFCTLLKQMRVSQKSAYRHFQDLIIKTPYEDIHGELVRFVELRGKYDKKKAEDIVSGLGFRADAFKALL